MTDSAPTLMFSRSIFERSLFQLPLFPYVIYLVLLLLAFAPGKASALEKPTIRWLTWEQVPNFITKGEYKGQGIGDSLTKILQQNLPGYNHENIVSNTRRYNRLIRDEDVCVAWAWIVPGSREYRVHSRPISLAPRTGIQTLKSKRHLFGEPGSTLSLSALLANDEIKLGYLEEMNYSKRVDDLIEQYRGTDSILFSSSSTVEFNLSMLDRDRVDYFFGFPAQANFEAETRGIPNKYQFYNIEEIDNFVSMYSHCSDTEFGRGVMKDIDNVLTTELLMDHLAVVERWYGVNRKYRDVFLDYVVNQNPNSRVSDPGQ